MLPQLPVSYRKGPGVMSQNSGSKSWVKILGQNLGSKSWVKILGQNLGSKSWVKIQGVSIKLKYSAMSGCVSVGFLF